MKPELSIILLNYNTLDYTLQCIRSIKKSNTNNYEIIVVDNASIEGDINLISKSYPEVVLIKNKSNRGFTGGNNDGVKAAIGKYLLILNNDTEIYDGTLEKIFDILKDFQSSRIATGFIEGDDHIPQLSGGKFPTIISELLRFSLYLIKYFPTKYSKKFFVRTWEQNSIMELDWASGCFFIMNREFYNRLGGFDENMFMYFEEVELHKRARELGASVFYYPELKIKHYGGKSAGKLKFKSVAYQYESTLYYFKKHHSRSAFISFKIATKAVFIIWFLIFTLTSIFGIKKIDEKRMLYKSLLLT